MIKVHEKVTVSEAKELYKKTKNELIDSESSSFVTLKGVNKVYPNGVQAVYDFNLDIDKHDFIALVGPSGCGKSTTLRMIAGLEEISSGYLYINKILSNYLPSKDRDIAMVFQSYALYPQMTVYENIAFGLQIRKIDAKEIQKRVFEAAKILDLGSYLDRKPKELSGGQMQRVALGRAIVRNAQLFLMDEPLSNLDAKLRVQMRSEIVRIHEEVGATTIYVTHDQIEAMTMATKIVVMNKGFIQQIGKPMEIYEIPMNLFVATFIGSPAMNILKVTYCNGKLIFDNGFKLTLPDSFKETYNKFILNKITKCEEYLNNIETLGKEEINRFKSAQVFSRNETDSISYINKQTFANRLLNLFHKKKININQDIDINKNEFKDKMESYLENYKSYLNNEHSIKIGIRPEHIYLANKEIQNASAEFIIKTTLVEVLGSEFNVHGVFNNMNIIAKLDTSTYIKPHSTIKLVFDISKIHFFDDISGERIN